MSDWKRPYELWLQDIGFPHSSKMFSLWLYTLPDFQIDEVLRKGADYNFLQSVGIARYGGTDLNTLCRLVKDLRTDSVLLIHPNLGELIEDPLYMKLLLLREVDPDIWKAAKESYREKAVTYYNMMGSNFPYYDEKEAERIKTLIAELALITT